VLAVAGTMVGALVGGMLLARTSFRWVFPAAAVVGLLATIAFSRIGVPAAPEDPSPPAAGLLAGFRVIKADRRFGLYSTCFYLYGFGNLIMGPVIPVFQVDELRITTQWVGYLATVASASSMIGYLYWGRVLDRHGPFRLMLMVIMVISLSPITYFLAHSVPVLLIAAAASGFAMAGGDLGYVNAAMRFGPRDAAAAYAGMFAFLQACRGIPGPFVGAALSSAIGPRWVFLIALGFWASAITILLIRGGLRADSREAGTAL
jgi:MFS family permease